RGRRVLLIYPILRRVLLVLTRRIGPYRYSTSASSYSLRIITLDSIRSLLKSSLKYSGIFTTIFAIVRLPAPTYKSRLLTSR
ncbi:hypothetical protein CABS01_13567, partial [Colletotrichum abscissum]|uniref:uncharacterized protein n=1 Tax=Colletotrichum abscissum TaxID=1671311 RepID=UPI0027D64FB2